MTNWPPSLGAMDADVAAPLAALFGTTAFELRWCLTGAAAVRIHAPRGFVSSRHAEPPDPGAAWTASARCGTATAWLLATEEPEDAVEPALQAAVDRHTALVVQRLAAHRAALASDLLESLTHRLRTDVTTLQTVAEGMIAGGFSDAERAEVAREVKDVGREAQRRLSAAREVMIALQSGNPREPEPISDVLRAELDGAGLAIDVEEPASEQARASLPGAGWAACARMLAEALATDARLGRDTAPVRITADPLGWTVEAGQVGPGPPFGWSARTLGPLAGAGHIAAAGGGVACSAHDTDRLCVRLTVPAAPSLTTHTS